MAIIDKVRVAKNKYGSWELHYTNPDGRRRRPSVGQDQQIAQRLSIKFTDWLLDGKDPEQEMEDSRKQHQAQSISIRQFFPTFMSRYGSQNSLKTQQSYRNSLKNICRCTELADCKLIMINKGLVLDYMNARVKTDGVTPATVNREAALLKVMISCAVEWEILNRNLLHKFKLLKEAPKREVRFSVNEAASLLDRLPKNVSNIVEFAIYSGLRRENILSLKIENLVIHEASGTADVVLKGNRREMVPLCHYAVDVLNRVIGKRKQGYVFMNPKTGTRYITIHKSFDKAVRSLDLTVNGTKFRFHDLRHAFAGLLINQNVGLDAIRSLMKHKDRRTTDRYATIDEEFSRKALEAMPKIERENDKKNPDESGLQLVRNSKWQELARSG